MPSRRDRHAPSFPPIAIVGRGCVLPGALDPGTLWDRVEAGDDLLGAAPRGAWRVSPDRVVPPGERNGVPPDRGGYVRGFESVFDPSGFALPPEEIQGLDDSTRWLLHAGRAALDEAGHGSDAASDRVGAILGNLLLPTAGLSRFAEGVWLGEDGPLDGIMAPAPRGPDPRHRFMSGLPVELLARALRLGGRTHALDAACASSLYAIRLACDLLHDGRSDLVLAGALNGTDPLFLHAGFRALQALSPSGRSRPFHRTADGLVPSLGVAVVALKRLEDAVSAGDRIFGVVRGVGLSNDGGARGLLVPDPGGQERAMRAAFAMSGLSPSDISLMECHATGTPAGDGAEIRSAGAVYGDTRRAEAEGLPIGSLKSNLGHTLTASGAAGLLKVLGAIEAGTLPATLHADEFLPEIQDSPFRLLQEAEPWNPPGLRRAAVSSFGFGGNNAHLLVEAWEGVETGGVSGGGVHASGVPDDIAVVALAVSAAGATDRDAFARALFEGTPLVTEPEGGTEGEGGRGPEGRMEGVSMPLGGLRFPPTDLAEALPQQVLLLQTARNAVAEAGPLPPERTGVYVGMQCDPEIARHMARVRLGEWAPRWANERAFLLPGGWAEEAGAAFAQPLTAPTVLGTLGNVVANRVSAQFGFAGPGFALAAEERSGIVALELAARALARHELDAAVVGAVDLCCEAVHRAAAEALLDEERRVPGDAAVVLVLKRRADAVRDGDRILAVLPGSPVPEDPSALHLGDAEGGIGLAPLFGHAQAASGLLHVAAGVLCCAHRARPGDAGPRPWLTDGEPRRAVVTTRSLGGEEGEVHLQEAGDAAPLPFPFPDRPFPGRPFPDRFVLEVYAGADRADVLAALEVGRTGDGGTARLAIAATSPEEALTRRADAAGFLKGERDHPPDGVAFRDAPVQGEIAFVFTGAGAAYPGMGRELVLGAPQLVEEVGDLIPRLRLAADWAYGAPGEEATPLRKLTGSSFLSQLHARVTTRILGLHPTATLGLSSGETNAVTALGAWDDLDGLLQGLVDTGMYTVEVGGRFEALARAWGEPAAWANWRVLLPAEAVQAAIAGEPRVFFTMRQGPSDCVIGGEAEACRRVAERIGSAQAQPLGYDLAVHAPILEQVEETWRALHLRPTRPISGVRCYTASADDPYEPVDADAIADALTGMARGRVDFPAMVERAWADGVRIFIEHGPRDLCTRWIRETLGEREHVAVAMDRPGTDARRQLLLVAAELAVAGVPVDVPALLAFLGRREEGEVETSRGAAASFAAHPSPVHIPRLEIPRIQAMPLAPTLPPVELPGRGAREAYLPAGSSPVPEDRVRAGRSAPTQNGAPTTSGTPPTPRAPVGNGTPATSATASGGPAASRSPIASRGAAESEGGTSAGSRTSPGDGTASGHGAFLSRGTAELTRAHREFLDRQAGLHDRFVRLQAAALLRAAEMRGTAAALPAPTRASAAAPSRAADPSPSAPPPPPVPTSTPSATRGSTPDPPRAADPADGPPPSPTRPLFGRAELESLASDRISAHFGPLFEAQDAYPRQVRMPMPPLLLADRVLEIRGEPGSMGAGSIVTETDVTEDAWYLHEGRMPAGIQVEAGQADLLLCSWLGADLVNRGERVYRLLGCELTFHGSRPRPGETIRYDIELERHARIGDVRLFFFNYRSTVDGSPRLTVQGGHAGFFTDEELRGSGGVIWDPSTEEAIPPEGAVPGRLHGERQAFAPDQVRAFAAGRPFECFGTGFEGAAAHVRSPRIQSGPMLLLDEVTQVDPEGGPWGRGYLRAVRTIHEDDWFFPGHFKNDPTMPGTLMYEGGLQAMAFYMAALGHTLDRDGWRFEPVPDVPYPMVCRGQVVPTSRELVYEIFVHGIEEGDEPILWADILLTADGLKAFHCKRMGLRLVPDWPLEAQGELLLGASEPGAASVDGFTFGQDSLLQCAWGRPSQAFGPRFERFDSVRRLPRLPGPPYHFMSRVTTLTGEMGVPHPGSGVEVEYDIPPDAWYFRENPGGTMPFCVLMEAALQPCGWLTAYMGIPLVSETDLRFRNLNGDGTVLSDVHPGDGVLRTRVTCTNVSRSGDAFIESFQVSCFVGERQVFTLDTTFGHFPPEALRDQVGLPFTEAERTRLYEAESEFLAEPPSGALGARAAGSGGEVHSGRPELALGRRRLELLTRVSGVWPTGSESGKPRLRGEMDVDPAAWFFTSHFFQDPVQPGSLGVEAMIQLLQFHMLERGLGSGFAQPRFQAIEVGRPVSWRYRGQVVPSNRRVHVEMEITEEGRDELGPFAVAEAWLWVDGKRIYSARNLGMRIVEGGEGRKATPVAEGPDGSGTEPLAREAGGPEAAPVVETTEPVAEETDAAGSEPLVEEDLLDPAVDRWLLDHRPTYTVPALPLTFMADRMAQAAMAARPDRLVVGLKSLEVLGWLGCAEPRRLRTEVSPVPGEEEAVEVRLLVWRDASVERLSRFEPVARARVRLGSDYPEAPAPLPRLDDTETVPDPYESGALIHGPAFRILESLELGSRGATATLDAGGGDTPPGLLNPLLLDGITHAIPNAELWRWSEAIDRGSVAYPTRILSASFHGETPFAGSVRCEVRFDGFHGGPEAPAFQVQLHTDTGVWADLHLVATLHPKGPIGALPGRERRDFILHRVPVPGAGLSWTDEGETRLTRTDVSASDWLPGTLRDLYGTDRRGLELAVEIAIKEHVARTAGVHPVTVHVESPDSGEPGNPGAEPDLTGGPGDRATVSATCPTRPYSRFVVAVQSDQDTVRVRDAVPERSDFTGARQYWHERLGAARWPVEDLYFAMADKFVRRVIVSDPEGFERIRGRSAVFVANHEVAIESFLFALLTPGLTGVPSVVLAKSEVRTRWLDEFLRLAEGYPGVRLPEFILYLEQKKPLQVLRTFERCKAQMAREGLSALVHVQGTRARACREPVTLISSSLIDMAIGADAPIVPVRFVGGLPVEPLESRLHVPLGHGSQDYHYGSPIFPEELRTVPYAERRQRVLDAINALGPGLDVETPNPPDPRFESEVRDWMERTGAGEEYSILLRALQGLPDPGPGIARVLEGVETGRLELEGDALGEWTADLAHRLFGERGPEIVVSGRRRDRP